MNAKEIEDLEFEIGRLNHMIERQESAMPRLSARVDEIDSLVEGLLSKYTTPKEAYKEEYQKLIRERGEHVQTMKDYEKTNASGRRELAILKPKLAEVKTLPLL